MMHRRAPAMLILISIVVGLAIVACVPDFLSQSESESTATPVPFSGNQEMADVISAEGVIVPYQEADLQLQGARSGPGDPGFGG